MVVSSGLIKTQTMMVSCVEKRITKNICLGRLTARVLQLSQTFHE